MELNTGLLTVIVGMLGILLGTFLSPYLNHRLTLKYNRRDFLFKKKLEYFEQIALSLEENIRMYTRTIKEISFLKDKKRREEVIKNIKRERKKFKIMGSPLYFNVEFISQKIKRFVEIEKEIFLKLERMQEKKVEEEIEEIREDLKEDIKKITFLGNELIREMRIELQK